MTAPRTGQSFRALYAKAQRGRAYWLERIRGAHTPRARGALAAEIVQAIVVGTPIFLAWYHNGFSDSGEELLAVCDSSDAAGDVIRMHQLTRDQLYEFRDKASWRVEPRMVQAGSTASVTPLDPSPPSYPSHTPAAPGEEGRHAD